MIVLFLLVGSSQLYGQGLTWMGIDLWRAMESARSRLGPIRLNGALIISNAGYDSNLYPSSREPPISDTMLTAGPDFNFFLPLQNTVVLELSESPSYAFYAKTEKERGWNNIFNGQLHFILKKLYFVFGRGLWNVRQRVSTEVDLRLRLNRDDFRGAALWQSSRWTSFLVEFQTTEYNYDDKDYGESGIPARLNRKENALRLAIFSQRSTRTRWHLDGEYISYAFPLDSVSRDSRSYSVYGGIDFLETSRIQGVLNLGYKYFTSPAYPGSDFKGIIGNTTLSLAITQHLEILGSFEKDVAFSIWGDNVYYDQIIYGPGISLQLSRNIWLRYDFSIGRNSYVLGEQNGGGDSEDRVDSYTTHTVRASIRLGRNFEGSLTARHWIRNSNLDLYDGKRDFIGMGLRYLF